jgi:hypothetical protein
MRRPQLGLEYKWRFFVFRPAGRLPHILIYNRSHSLSSQVLKVVLRNEFYLLFGVLFYVAVALYGRAHNLNMVNKWYVRVYANSFMHLRDTLKV